VLTQGLRLLVLGFGVFVFWGIDNVVSGSDQAENDEKNDGTA